MAGLLDWFSGGSDADLYGGLLSEAQRSALATRGLASMAEKFAQMAMPSRAPIPLGAVLGSGFGAYGTGTDEAVKTAFEAQVKGAQARQLQSQVDFAKQIGPLLGQIPGLLTALGTPGTPGAAATPGSGSTGGAAVSPGAGGGGAGTYWTPEGLAALRPTEGRYDQIHYPSGSPSTASGAYGFLDSTWREQAAKAGVDINQYPRAYLAPPAVQDKVAAITPIHHWTGVDAQGKPFNAAAQRLATNPVYIAGAAPSAASAAPAGGGGLLNLPQVPSFARDQFGAAAAAPVAGGVATAPTVPLQQLLNKNRQDFGDFGEGSGSSAAAPEDIYAGYPTTAEEAGGGDAPGGMVSGLLAPGGPLTRGGVPGMPAMPAAPPPSADPGLQLGPLAPAPAAAAPAAAGPGLLSPQFTAPAATPASSLPQVDPRFGAVAALINQARVASTLAGFKDDPLKALYEGLTGSPAYKAQLEIAARTAGLPFTQAEDLYKKQVEIAGVGPIEAAKLPYALAQEYFKADQQIRTAGPVAAAQNFERIRADNAAKGIITTKDADGQIKLSIDPDAVKAVTGATITAPKQAEADIARETKRIEQEQAARYDPMPGGVPVMGADGKTTMMPMSRYEYDLRKRLEAERRAPGSPSSGPQPGDIVGTPYVSKEEEQSREIDLKTLESKRATAESARLAIQNANDVQDLIAKGVVMGPGESVRSGLLKLGYALKLTGKDENDLIANTEAFISRQGSELKDALKGLGPPISNIDVQTAGGIAGGKNLTVQGLQELMRIKEKYHRQALTEYNEMAAQAPPGRFDRTIKEPPTYGAKTATGPNGQRMWEKSPGNWVPF